MDYCRIQLIELRTVSDSVRENRSEKQKLIISIYYSKV